MKYLIGVVVVLTGLGIGWGLYHEQQREDVEWAAFSAAHHCQLMDHTDSHPQATVMLLANGQTAVGTVIIPGNDSWKCGDMIYNRSN